MKECFVFASNLSGLHGGGSAYAAFLKHGAVWGCGIGYQGNSYAIPTLDEYLDELSLGRIKIHIDNFLAFATKHSEITFNIVAIGCGIAGFKPEEIAPMFKDVPENCKLPPEFVDILRD